MRSSRYRAIILVVLLALLIGVLAPQPASARRQAAARTPTATPTTPTLQEDLQAPQKLADNSAPAPIATPNDLAVAATGSATVRVIADTELRQAEPNSNLADDLLVDVGYRNGQRGRMLIELPTWNLPPNSTITSAILKFHVNGWRDIVGVSRTITAYHVSEIWHEELATWNYAPTFTEAIGSVSVPPVVGLWHDIDITSAAQKWAAGEYPNYGIMLVGPEAGDSVYRTIASGETTDYPRVEISYTTKPPALAVTPASLSVLATSRGVAPGTQSISIANNGSTALEWSASVGGDTGIVLNETSGIVGPGITHTVGLSFHLAGVSPGQHTRAITISSSTAGVAGAPQSIAVALNNAPGVPPRYMPAMINLGQPAPAPKVVALIIGISDYKNLSPAPASGTRAGIWAFDLGFGQNDAARAKLVTNATMFTALPNGPQSAHDNVRVLTNSQASLGEIDAGLDWVAEEADPNTTVVIAYSGHGAQVPDDNGDEADGKDEIITAYDTDDSGGTFSKFIRDDELNRRLSNIRSLRVVLILDSCFSGGMPPTTSSPGRVYLMASKGDQLSWEFGSLGNGVFSYYVYMALLDPAADTDHNGWVSAEEAFAYALARVDGYVSTSTPNGDHQNPQLDDQVPGNVDLAKLTS